MNRYDDAKFGIFIHWYAFEWSRVSCDGSAVFCESIAQTFDTDIRRLYAPYVRFRGVYSVPSWAPVGQYAEWYWYRLENGSGPTYVHSLAYSLRDAA